MALVPILACILDYFHWCFMVKVMVGPSSSSARLLPFSISLLAAEIASLPLGVMENLALANELSLVRKPHLKHMA